MTPQSALPGVSGARPAAQADSAVITRKNRGWAISTVAVMGVLVGGLLVAVLGEGARLEAARIDAVTALTAVVVPPSAFVRAAEPSLAELGSGLDTIAGTLDRGGFWGVLTSSVDIGYSAAHLRSLEPPDSIAVQWRSALDHLDAGITAIDDGIAAADANTIRVAVTDARLRFEALRALVATVP